MQELRSQREAPQFGGGPIARAHVGYLNLPTETKTTLALSKLPGVLEKLHNAVCELD